MPSLYESIREFSVTGYYSALSNSLSVGTKSKSKSKSKSRGHRDGIEIKEGYRIFLFNYYIFVAHTDRDMVAQMHKVFQRSLRPS